MEANRHAVSGVEIETEKCSLGGRAPATSFDYYRHGIFPKVASGGEYFQTKGGKISYNILYADGHVITSHDRSDAYMSILLQYPYKIGNGGLSNSYPE